MNFFERLDDTVRWIKDSLLAILVVPLLATVAWLWVTLYGFLWFDGVQDKLTKAQLTISKMNDASEKSAAEQERLNADNAGLNQRITDHAVDQHEANAAAVGTAIDAFIADRRLHPNAKGCPTRTGAPAVHRDPVVPADPGTTAELVAVPTKDLEQLSKAAVQGNEATSFLIDLVNAGLAVPDKKNVP